MFGFEHSESIMRTRDTVWLKLSVELEQKKNRVARILSGKQQNIANQSAKLFRSMSLFIEKYSVRYTSGNQQLINVT